MLRPVACDCSPLRFQSFGIRVQMYGFVNKFVVRKTGRKLGICGVILVHQKLETSSIAYALDLAGWALRVCRWQNI